MQTIAPSRSMRNRILSFSTRRQEKRWKRYFSKTSRTPSRSIRRYSRRDRFTRKLQSARATSSGGYSKNRGTHFALSRDVHQRGKSCANRVYRYSFSQHSSELAARTREQ